MKKNFIARRVFFVAGLLAIAVIVVMAADVLKRKGVLESGSAFENITAAVGNIPTSAGARPSRGSLPIPDVNRNRMYGSGNVGTDNVGSDSGRMQNNAAQQSGGSDTADAVGYVNGDSVSLLPFGFRNEVESVVGGPEKCHPNDELRMRPDYERWASCANLKQQASLLEAKISVGRAAITVLETRVKALTASIKELNDVKVDSPGFGLTLIPIGEILPVPYEGANLSAQCVESENNERWVDLVGSVNSKFGTVNTFYPSTEKLDEKTQVIRKEIIDSAEALLKEGASLKFPKDIFKILPLIRRGMKLMETMTARYAGEFMILTNEGARVGGTEFKFAAGKGYPGFAAVRLSECEVNPDKDKSKAYMIKLYLNEYGFPGYIPEGYCPTVGNLNLPFIARKLAGAGSKSMGAIQAKLGRVKSELERNEADLKALKEKDMSGAQCLEASQQQAKQTQGQQPRQQQQSRRSSQSTISTPPPHPPEMLTRMAAPSNRDNLCYDFTPPNLGQNVNVKITAGGQEKVISIPNQNPVSLLQSFSFGAKRDNRGTLVCPLRALTGDFLNLNFLPISPWIPFAGAPFDIVDSTGAPTNFLSWIDYYGHHEIGGDTAPKKIANEDSIIGEVDKNKRIRIGVGLININPPISNVHIVSTPATNCAKLSGTGPKKIVFMRGTSWDAGIDDFIWQASAARERFLATDPFKTYASQFSFYADLKKSDSASASSCGTGIFERIIFTSNQNNPSIGISSRNNNVDVVSVNVARADLLGPTAIARSLPHAVLRETGRIFAKLQEEQYTTNSSGRVDSPLTNCTTEPFKDFRDEKTNHIWGAIDEIGCRYEKDASNGKIYYRSTSESLMNTVGNARVVSPPADSEKFNVVSCGHLVSAIKGEPLTKGNALKYWPECLNMDTAKGGIPSVVAAPRISNISVVTKTDPDEFSENHPLAKTQKSLVQFTGSGFTAKGNTVQFVSKADATEIYEVTNLPTDAGNLSFTIPADLPVGSYFIKVGALNSDWSNALEVKVHGGAPSNLVAVASKKGEVKLSWIDNASDETSLEAYRRLDSEELSFHGFLPIRSRKPGPDMTSDTATGLEPSKQYTFAAKAEFDDGSYSDYITASVTTLPKPRPPVLSAEAISDSEIGLSWTDNDSADIKEYIVLEKPSNKEISRTVAAVYSIENLDPGTRYCYAVRSSVNNKNNSDDSNRACAKTLDLSASLNVEDIMKGLSALSGPVSFPFNQDLRNVSSVRLFVDDGKAGVIASDESAPWNFAFDSRALTNGPHNIYAVIYRTPATPGGPSRVFPTKPIVITINNPVEPPAPPVASISFKNSLQAPAQDILVGDLAILGGFTATPIGEPISVKNLRFRIFIGAGMREKMNDLFDDLSDIGLYNSAGVLVSKGERESGYRIVFEDAFTIDTTADYIIRARLGPRFKPGDTIQLYANFYRDAVIFTGTRSGGNANAPRGALGLSKMTATVRVPPKTNLLTKLRSFFKFASVSILQTPTTPVTPLTRQSATTLSPEPASVVVTQSSPLSVSCMVSPNQVSMEANQSVTWTATPSGGTPPYSYLWGGNDQTLAGKITQDVTFSYDPALTPREYKWGQVKVTDSSGASTGDVRCGNGVSVSNLNDDYELFVTPLATINFIGQTAASNRIAINIGTINPGWFNSPITVTASPSTIGGVPVSYIFYKHGDSVPITSSAVITDLEYKSGLDMVVKASKFIAPGHYPGVITVFSAGGLKAHDRPVDLDVNDHRPKFQEF